ncbi:response regulator transcription factor [Sorangium sp. So ce1014]|uniref:response regulator transcription factor n=1 Tax=unclassified Sorangium TaxID=2621164 RepID=UPI003F62C0F5
MATRAKILVIEDDRDSSDMLAEMLGMAGYEVESASTADQAIAALTERRYEAALLDLTVKGATTAELVERLQEVPERPPLVIFSARMPEDLRQAAKELSAAAFLQKPASMAALLSTMDRVVRPAA